MDASEPTADVKSPAQSPGSPAPGSPRLSLGAEIAAGFRRNLIPGLVLQCMALAVALGYFFWPAGRAVCDQLAAVRDQGGYIAGAGITAICGGLIPWLVMRWRGDVPKGVPAGADCAFMMLYWAFAGFEVDLFYRYQAEWWGGGKDVATVAAKVACDQFGFTLFLAVPQMRTCFRWRESGYRSDAWAGFTWTGFFREILVLAASAWVVWIPGTSIIYAMPTNLQFLLFALVLVFWSLVAAVAGRPKRG